jgi:hypothetical protein
VKKRCLTTISTLRDVMRKTWSNNTSNQIEGLEWMDLPCTVAT